MDASTMFLAIIFLAILVVVIASGMWGLYYYVVLPGLKEHKRLEAPPEYHYRHCKTCDYTYMVSSEYEGPDPGCPACGDEWHTETLWLQHKRIKGKWQDVSEPPRITGFAANIPLFDKPRAGRVESGSPFDAGPVQGLVASPVLHTVSIRAQVHRNPPELDHLSQHSAQYEPTLEADD